MTPSEFKAWFDGFTEAFTGMPNKAQWTRIKARVAEIDGRPTTHTVYVDRYLPSVRPYWQYMGFSTCNASSTLSGGNTGSLLQNAAQSTGVYDSHRAMAMVGRADAMALAS